MKHGGIALEEVRRLSAELATERTETLAAKLKGRSLPVYVEAEYGKHAAALVPPDISASEFLEQANDGDLHFAEARLRECARCPSHGGACASEYAALQGREPVWVDSERGLHLAWCPRWRTHRLREKLTAVGIPERLLGARFDTYEATNDVQRKAVKKCRAYAEKFELKNARNLFIVGQNFGIGKSHLATAIVADLLVRRVVTDVMFVYVPGFLEMIRRSYDEPEHRGLRDRASTAELLVMDDLGAERTTPWVQEQMNLISNARWGGKRPTLMTTNTTPQEIEKTLGPRASSRLLGPAIGIEVNGIDRRWQNQP